jgi:hypothetical protein
MRQTSAPLDVEIWSMRNSPVSVECRISTCFVSTNAPDG